MSPGRSRRVPALSCDGRRPRGSVANASPAPALADIRVAASLASYVALLLYSSAFGPGGIGAALDFRQRAAGPRPAVTSGSTVVADGTRGARVTAVEPGGPAERAGLLVGDRVVGALGQPVTTLFDWYAVGLQMEVGQPFPLLVERDERPREVALARRPHWRSWTAGTWLLFGLKALGHALILGLAVFLAFARWNDPVARLGALFLGGLAVTNLFPLAALDPHAPTLPNGAYATWRQLPLPLHAPLLVGLLTFLVSPLLPMPFFVMFPRPLFRTRRSRLWFFVPWFLVSAPVVAALVYWSVREIYTPWHVTALFPPWFTPLVGTTVLVAIACGLTCFVANYRRLADPNERRRVRLVVAGAVVGMAPQSLFATSAFFASPTVHAMARSPWLRAASSLLFLAFPIAFVYAIARHRLFDVRVLVRQGLQYALARRLLLSILPACALVLTLDLLVHGDQPLRAILGSRGWIYASVAALALLAHAKRTEWLGQLDRRFFRERYDAQRLLRQIVEDLRSETTLERAAPRVVSQIEGALHPEFAALMLHQTGDTFYRAVASAPADPAASPAARLEQAGNARPGARQTRRGGHRRVGLDGGATPARGNRVRAARIGLLVPVATAVEEHDALLALGVKRSQEPYSREDQELMATLASSLALVVARPASPSPADAFTECPRCGACYDTGARECARDRTALVAVRVPRRLADRYRIERRLGHGGMGTVYEATDTQLDRRVAVKVVREEWAGDDEAAERFRREARAAASFSHPNVVTVHDFGLAGGTRAFLVMELLHGALREVLAREGRLAPPRAMALLRGVCEGADAAHRRNLVHRDLKPENVFLVDDGGREQAKILDFGIAKLLATDAEATSTGTGVLGTLHYMGPEQLRGGTVDRPGTSGHWPSSPTRR